MNLASRVLTWRRDRSRLAAVLAVGAVVSVLAAVPAATASAAGNPASATGSTAPPLTILTPSADSGDDDIFLAPVAPAGDGYASGPEIVTTTGKVAWFNPLPAGALATDFRTQTYQGQPVLTWFQDDDANGARGVVYNDRFQQIATVHAGNGFGIDEHEFLITPSKPRSSPPTASRRSTSGPSAARLTRRSRSMWCRRSTSRPAGCCSSGTPPITCPTATATCRCRPRRAKSGTGSTSTPSTSTRTATCWSARGTPGRSTR